MNAYHVHHWLRFYPCIFVALTVLMSVWRGEAAGSALNYSFATAVNGSLTDMSTGTTPLLPANSDDTASPLASIGFDFYFVGVRYTQFGVNDNGVVRLGALAQTTSPYQPLGQANIPILTAYGADQRVHAGDGKVHYKVTGVAPNRVLVIEWLNNQAYFNTGGTADLTYQVRLFETSGVIEYVYGSMTMTVLVSVDPNSQKVNIGFSSGNTAALIGAVTAAQSGTPAPTYNGASPTPATNIYTVGPITTLSSVADGSRRVFTFTPIVPVAPTGLSFSSIGSISMTLNWTDNGVNDLGYAIYHSTDNTNFTFAGISAMNATSMTLTNLMAGTNYFFRVYAASEGALSGPLTGNQSTLPAGNIVSTGAGGLWSATGTWVGGAVPTAADNVTISAGAVVTIDTGASAYSVLVNGTGTLQFDATTLRRLDVGQSVTIAANGIFQSGTSAGITTHMLFLGGNLTNNGTLDFSTSGNAAGAGITFTNNGSAVFTGSGSTDIRTLVINKGLGGMVELKTADFSVQGATTDGATANYLTLGSGVFKVSGNFTNAFRTFPTAAYTIPAGAGFWLNNSNYTVSAQSGSCTLNGLLRVSQGTFNIGTATGNSMNFNSGSTVIMEGGVINAAGRFALNAAGNFMTYIQSGGVITVCTAGNTATANASFDLGTATVSTISITGGTVVLQLANTATLGPRDYRNNAGDGPASVTGGTLQVGNANSGAAKNFLIGSVIPNLVVNNASANHSVMFRGDVTNYSNSVRNVTIPTGSTLNLTNTLLRLGGVVVTNNGTLVGTGANSRLQWAGDLVNAPQLYTGSGTVTAPLSAMEFNNVQGVTIDSASPAITTLQVNLVNGNVTNANKLIVGNGGATTGTIQIGDALTPAAPGVFDVAPTFNLGSGGQVLTYLRMTSSRVMGNEINPARGLSSLTVNTVTNDVLVSGGNVAITNSLALTSGRIITSSNILAVNSGAVVSRTAGHVAGNLRKTFAVTGSKTFELGTTNYSPVTVNVTAGTFPGDVTVSAQGARQPNYPGINALKRFWTLSAPASFTADLAFQYQAIDVLGTEADYTLAQYNGIFSAPASVLDTVNHIGSANGIASLAGDWTLFETDNDFDGMPNTFETAHGLNQNNATDAVTDADNDGTSNFAEYFSGTDPQNAMSVLKLIPVVSNGPVFVLNLSVVSNKTYQVEYRNTLTETWQTFTNFTAPASSLVQIGDASITGQPQRYYRVGVLPP